MSKRSIIGLALVTVALTLSAADRNDEIAQKVLKFLSNHGQYQNVTFVVEDEIATVSGKVALWSRRSDLEWSLRRIEHVRSVPNQVVLGPPPVSDELLRARMKKAPTAAGSSHLKFQAHQGQVILTGSVRTRSQRARARDISLTVEGVREVETRVRVEGE